MADVFTPEHRSRVMRAVKSRDTAPELKVRRAAHALGLRFRLYRADLPGKPDLVFVSRRTALFVHGCFWHGHDCARGARIPKTNQEYWIAKVARNCTRDAKNRIELADAGWKAITIWECQTGDQDSLKSLIKRYILLDPPRP